MSLHRADLLLMRCTSTHFCWNMSRVFVRACKETVERKALKKVRHRCFKRRRITHL